MSDAPALEGAEGGSGPALSGQAEQPPAQPDASPPEPQYDYLDIDDETATKYVKVKIDGQEQSVPLREALDGYQRQQVFTQKTQELAEQRRQADEALRLHQAMQTNPGLTVQILANHAGMSVQDFLGLTPAQQAAAVQEPEYDDPLEREIAQERAARQQLEQRIAQREADEQLARTVFGLQQQYGLNDDQLRAVVGTAMQMNLGVEYLPMVYQAMAFQAQQAALLEQQQTQQSEEQRRQQAAQQAAAVVGNGAGVTPGAPVAASNGYSSYREAIEAAYDEVERRHR